MSILIKVLDRVIIAIVFIATLVSCSTSRDNREASLLSQKITHTVVADFETEPLKNRKLDEDAADDPAIWINSENPMQSRIIGTDKKGGLAVYDMEGKELFFYADGRMNNADVRYDFPYGSEKIDIVATSNRTTRGIDIYKINKDGSLEKINTEGLQSPMEKNVYGFTLGKDLKTNTYYAYVNSKAGEVVQWKLTAEKGIIRGEVVREMKLASKLEGMVADDISGTLFIGEEAKGIWYTTLTEQSIDLHLIADSDLGTNKAMKEDIEGLAVYRGADGVNYLLASSQGNNSYAVFQLEAPYPYLGSFRIVADTVDGVEDTDGIEAVSVALGTKYPKGIFVVQDGFNTTNGKPATQNFKVVNWLDIEKVIANF